MNNQYNIYDTHFGLDLPELKYETDLFPCPEDYLEVVYIDRFLNFNNVTNQTININSNNAETKHLPTVKVANPDLLGKQLQKYLKTELKKYIIIYNTELEYQKRKKMRILKEKEVLL